jgi:hypothetical protein
VTELRSSFQQLSCLQTTRLERAQLQMLCEDVVQEYDAASRQVSALLSAHACSIISPLDLTNASGKQPSAACYETKSTARTKLPPPKSAKWLTVVPQPSLANRAP